MHDIFRELSLVIAFATGIALIMRLLKQPLIIGHILTGVLVGPLVFGFTSDEITFQTFSSIGVALLLFIVGLGLNPRAVKEVGKVAGIAGIFQVVSTTILGFAVGKLLHFSSLESLFFGFCLAISSTIIILKLLGDKKDQSRLYGKITIGMSLVEDIGATIALIFVASKSGESSLTMATFIYLALKGTLVGILMYRFSTRILPRYQRLVAGNQEFLFLFALAWGLGSATLFRSVGFSQEVGALFGGICLSTLPYAQEIAARLRPLRDFFIIVFFITLGSGLELGVVTHAIPIIIAGVFITVVLKPLAILSAMGFLGYTKKTSFKTASAMSQISEFSLIFILLATQQKLVREEFVSALTMIAIITIAASTYLIIYSDKIYEKFEKFLGFFERRIPKNESEHTANFEYVLIGYQRGGHEFIKVFEHMKKRYVIIDYDPDIINLLENKGLEYLYGDVSDIELLDEAGVAHAKLIVSTITNHDSTILLLNYIEDHNPHAVVICHADSIEQAEELYKLGASYVMIPHYIGSEKISSFIKKVGIRKSEFKKIRNKHLQYLEAQMTMLEKDNDQQRTLGHAILEAIGGKKD